MYGKINIRQRFRSRLRIGQSHMIKLQGGNGVFYLSGSVLHTARNFEDTLNPVSTGYCFGYGDNQVCQFYQLYQNLIHVVHQCNHLALCQNTCIYPDSSRVEKYNDSAIYNNVGYRIHKTGDTAYKFLQIRQMLILLTEMFLLLLFHPECTDDTDTGQIFSGHTQYLVKCTLHSPIHGHGPKHNSKDYNGQKRNRNNKYKRRFHIYRKCHNHGPKYDKRGTKEQTKHQIDAGLDLIDVTGHTGHQCRGTDLVHLRIREALDMSEQLFSQYCGKSCRRLCCKVLGRNRAGQADHTQGNENEAHSHNITPVASADTHIDDGCHNQRHKKLKERFQHFKKRCQNRLLFIPLQVNKKFFHDGSPLFRNRSGFRISLTL